MARRSGVVRRMSPMELKRTARMFGALDAWGTPTRYSVNGER
jgi:hypothetical protein